MAASERGNYRGIYCALIDRLADEGRTPDERHVFLTARLSEQAGPASIFRCNPAVLAHQTGLPVARVVKALRGLEPDWLEYEPPVLWLKNGLRYDPHVHLSNPKQRLGIERWIAALPRLPIVLNFCDYYGITRPFKGQMDSPSNGSHPLSPAGEGGTTGKNLEKGGGSRERMALAVLSDGQFIEQLRANPAYTGIDLERELAKMDAYLLTPRARGRKKTRQFIVNWLNRIDRPLVPHGPAASDPGARGHRPLGATAQTAGNPGVLARALERERHGE